MSYSDARYGVVKRIIMSDTDDAGATGISAGSFSFNKKTKIIKFGIIPSTPAVLTSTTQNWTLETAAGTDLGTFTPGSSGSLSVEVATGNTITATTVSANKVLKGNITVSGASAGSFHWYVDVKEQYDVDATDANV